MEVKVKSKELNTEIGYAVLIIEQKVKFNHGIKQL